MGDWHNRKPSATGLPFPGREWCDRREGGRAHRCRFFELACFVRSIACMRRNSVENGESGILVGVTSHRMLERKDVTQSFQGETDDSFRRIIPLAG